MVTLHKPRVRELKSLVRRLGRTDVRVLIKVKTDRLAQLGSHVACRPCVPLQRVGP